MRKLVIVLFILVLFGVIALEISTLVKMMEGPSTLQIIENMY